MAELFKGQLSSFKQRVQNMVDDPLAEMKILNTEEDEKFNVFDDTHKPIGMLFIEFGRLGGQLVHLMACVNYRTTDKKITCSHRFLERDGTKEFNIMRVNKQRWFDPFVLGTTLSLEGFVREYFRPHILTSKSFGATDEDIKEVYFSPEADMKEVIQLLIEKDIAYVAEVDLKNHTSKIYNED